MTVRLACIFDTFRIDWNFFYVSIRTFVVPWECWRHNREWWNNRRSRNRNFFVSVCRPSSYYDFLLCQSDSWPVQFPFSTGGTQVTSNHDKNTLLNFIISEIGQTVDVLTLGVVQAWGYTSKATVFMSLFFQQQFRQEDLKYRECSWCTIWFWFQRCGWSYRCLEVPRMFMMHESNFFIDKVWVPQDETEIDLLDTSYIILFRPKKLHEQ